MIVRASAKSARSALLVALTFGAVGVLLVVYRIALNNNSSADEEAGWLARTALRSLALIGGLGVVANLVGRRWEARAPRVIVAGCVGGFVAVAISSAFALLLPWVMPAMEDREAGRTWFPVLYLALMAVALAAGLLAASMYSGRARNLAIVAAILALAFTLASWNYLATSSSEFNQCWINDQFPLDTHHVCAGY